MSNFHISSQGSERKTKSESGNISFLIALPERPSAYRTYRDGFIKHLEKNYKNYKTEREILDRVEAAQDFRWLLRKVREQQIKNLVNMNETLSWSMKKLYDRYLRPAAVEENTNKKKKNAPKNKNVCLEPGRILPYLELKSSHSKYCHVCQRAQPLVRICTECSRQCFYQCSVNLIYQQLGRCWNKAVADQVDDQPWLCHYCNELKKGAIKDTETNEKLKVYYGKKARKTYERCAMDETCESKGQYVTGKWKLVCKACGKLRPLTRACFGCHNWFTTPPPLNYNKSKPVTVFSIFFCVKCKAGVGDDIAEFDNYITKMKEDEE